MKQYFRAATPRLVCEVRNLAGALTAATGVTCTIEDENGKMVSATATEAMSTDDTGIYYYAGWTVPATALAGKYRWRPICTDGSYVTADAEGEFEIMDRQEGIMTKKKPSRKDVNVDAPTLTMTIKGGK